jgi:phosphoglycerate dehydrogenase-like enzyme
LWSIETCTITPHSAGGHADEHARLVRHFLANLRRFESGERLVDGVL